MGFSSLIKLIRTSALFDKVLVAGVKSMPFFDKAFLNTVSE